MDDEEVNILWNSLSPKEKNLNDATVQVNNFTESLSSKEKDLGDAAEEVNNTRKNLSPKEKNLGDAAEEIKNMRESLSSKEKDLGDAAEGVNNLRENLSPKEKNLSDALEEANNVRESLFPKENDLGDAAEEVNNTRESLSSKEKDLGDAAEEVNNMRENLSPKEKNLGDAAEEINNMRESLSSKEKDLGDAAEEVNNTRENLSPKEKNLGDAVEEVNNLSKSLSLKEKDLGDAAAEVNNFKKSLSPKEKMIDAVAEEYFVGINFPLMKKVQTENVLSKNKFPENNDKTGVGEQDKSEHLLKAECSKIVTNNNFGRNNIKSDERNNIPRIHKERNNSVDGEERKKYDNLFNIVSDLKVIHDRLDYSEDKRSGSRSQNKGEINDEEVYFAENDPKYRKCDNLCETEDFRNTDDDDFDSNEEDLSGFENRVEIEVGRTLIGDSFAENCNEREIYDSMVESENDRNIRHDDFNGTEKELNLSGISTLAEQGVEDVQKKFCERGKEIISDFHPERVGKENISDFHPERVGKENISDLHPERLDEESISDFHPERLDEESISDFHPERVGKENISDFLPERVGKENISDFHPERADKESISDFHPERVGKEIISDFHPERLDKEGIVDYNFDLNRKVLSGWDSKYQIREEKDTRKDDFDKIYNECRLQDNLYGMECERRREEYDVKESLVKTPEERIYDIPKEEKNKRITDKNFEQESKECDLTAEEDVRKSLTRREKELWDELAEVNIDSQIGINIGKIESYFPDHDGEGIFENPFERDDDKKFSEKELVLQDSLRTEKEQFGTKRSHSKNGGKCVEVENVSGNWNECTENKENNNQWENDHMNREGNIECERFSPGDEAEMISSELCDEEDEEDELKNSSGRDKIHTECESFLMDEEGHGEGYSQKKNKIINNDDNICQINNRLLKTDLNRFGNGRSDGMKINSKEAKKGEFWKGKLFEGGTEMFPVENISQMEDKRESTLYNTSVMNVEDKIYDPYENVKDIHSRSRILLRSEEVCCGNSSSCDEDQNNGNIKIHTSVELHLSEDDDNRLENANCDAEEHSDLIQKQTFEPQTQSTEKVPRIIYNNSGGYEIVFSENINEQAELMRKTCSIFTIIMGLITAGGYYGDLLTDLAICYVWMRDGHPLWFALSLFFTVFPTIIVNVMSFMEMKSKREKKRLLFNVKENTWKWMVTVISHLFLLGPMIRYAKVFRDSISFYVLSRDRLKTRVLREVYFSEISGYMWLFKLETISLSNLAVTEGFLESAPQLVLQMYTMAVITDGTDDRTRVITQVASMAFSLFKLSWSLTRFNEAKNIDPVKTLATVFNFLWLLFTFASRVISVALFATVFPTLCLSICCSHIALASTMVAYDIYVKKTSTPRSLYHFRELKPLVFILIFGAIHVLCYPEHGAKPRRYRYVTYYSIVGVENAVFIILWFSYVIEVQQWFHILTIAVVFVCYVLGITSLIIYHRFFYDSVRMSEWPSFLRQRVEYKALEASETKAALQLFSWC